MVRSYTTFILAVIGLPMIFSSFGSPLFEWQIDEITTDFPSHYDVNISPTPWITRWGESIEDKAHDFQVIDVGVNGKACSLEDIHLVVKRSQSDTLLEQLSLLVHLDYDAMNLVVWWILIEMGMSIIFIWYTLWHQTYPVLETIAAMFLAILTTLFYGVIVLQTIRLMGPMIPWERSQECHGTIMVSAKLFHVYSSVPILLLTGIIAEVAALVIMVRQVMVTVGKRKESPKPAVG